MLKVGLTGGIGSGKSLVAKMFALLGVPVFNADDVAKFLMENNSELASAIQQAFGRETYKNGRLNRSFLASKVFTDPERLKFLNNLVHPVTIAYAKKWMEKQTTLYVLKEAALFFETGSNREMNLMIGVYAPEDMRLERALKRGGHTRSEILARMSNQMNEEEKMKRCDYLLYNDDSRSVIEQVLGLHELLTGIAQKS
jgi:dephospho-CoA kinase